TPVVGPDPGGDFCPVLPPATGGPTPPCRGPRPASPAIIVARGQRRRTRTPVPPMAAVNQLRVRMVRTAHPPALKQLPHWTGKGAAVPKPCRCGPTSHGAG